MTKAEEKPYNASDESQVKAREQKVKSERDQELEDIKEILSRPSGVRFFKRLLREGRIFQTTFTGNSYSYFNEGARNLVLKFFSDVCEATPNKVHKLMTNIEKE